jgi:hypothetical protein
MNTEQSTSTDEKASPISSLELWLYGVLFGWPLAVALYGNIFGFDQNAGVWYPIGSSLLGLLLAIIALRNYTLARHFLRCLVAVLLISVLLAGGFYHNATLASDGSLWRTMVHTYHMYDNVQPPVSRQTVISNLLDSVTHFLHHPDQDWRVLIPMISDHIMCYARMAAPYHTLLLLMTPRFLAMPIYYGLVLLGALYVVLPSRAWKWVRGGIAKTRLMLRRH